MNFYFRVDNVSRNAAPGHCRSLVGMVSYITGTQMYDSYSKRTYYSNRNDVLRKAVFLPRGVPSCYLNPEYLCEAINAVEIRKDARTAREIIASLANEIPVEEQWQVVQDFVTRNFTDRGLCAIAALHEGKNEADSSRDNPHVHLAISTRTLGADGFSRKKDRVSNGFEYPMIWRKEFAEAYNRGYERCGLDMRVSHLSLQDQGLDREPLNHLSRIDYQRELRGERTAAGDKRRAIRAHNEEREHQRELERGLQFDLERENELSFELSI